MLNFIFNNSNFGIDWGNILAIITSGFIGAFGAIYVGNKNNETQRELNEKELKVQKELWSKDAYIKYEAEVITECKKIYDEVFPYIHHLEINYRFHHAFLLNGDAKNKITKEEYFDYYLKPLEKIKDIYMKNKQIFTKHGLDKAFEGILLYHRILKHTKNIAKTVDSDIGNPQEEPFFWCCFPYLTLNPSVFPTFEYCQNELTREMINEFEEIIGFYLLAIEEMDTILSKIMLVGEYNEKVSPSYIISYSLNYYNEYKKRKQNEQ